MDKYTSKVWFIDADETLVIININVENGKVRFNGVMGNSCGQVGDCIVPRTDNQRKLVEMWEKYHLNDMHAGTEKQEEFLSKHGEAHHNYNQQCKLLEEAGLLVDSGYRYGTSWRTRKLPDNFINTLKEVVDSVWREHYKLPEIMERDSNTPMGVAMAIHQYLYEQHDISISPELCQKLFSKHGNYTASDRNYNWDFYVGEQMDLDNIAAQQLVESKELWLEEVKNGKTELSLSDWADQFVLLNGFSSVLNSWNGNYAEVRYNNRWIVCCQS